MSKVLPYGSWVSPITSDLVAQSVVTLGSIQLDGNNLYWTETRADEGGRCVIVQYGSDGITRDVTTDPYNVRTRVHEYGGLCFWAMEDSVWFTNYSDQRVYWQRIGEQPVPVTPEAVDLRYADGMIDSFRRRLVCVREDHRKSAHSINDEAINTIVYIDLETGGEGRVLVEGDDFYGYPAISPDGSQISWLSWDHPNMPWDRADLWLGDLDNDGSIARVQRIAGAPGESVFQPEWSPDGKLHFISDRSGWWNLYRRRNGKDEPLAPMKAEFGVPLWTLGSRTYAFDSADRICCTYVKNGSWHLGTINTQSKQITHLKIPYSDMARSNIVASQGKTVLVAGSPELPQTLLSIDLNSGTRKILKTSQVVSISKKYFSIPEMFRFKTKAGKVSYGIYYPAYSPSYRGPPGENPPLLVISHGGPTAAASSSLKFEYQYWTSRGISIVDVNYGGSTGYGTEYRRRLNGKWGIVDVEDCVNAALHLVKGDKVDGERLVIRGASAGGFTTLSALTFTSFFSAGASYYGVSDLEALMKDTHKFESRYLDSLIGKYSTDRENYQKRSPINHTNLLSCPIIIFQGSEDKIVPPNQAEMMVTALRRKGVPVAYLLFSGEQHGFRKSKNIIRAIEEELSFYSQILGFERIENAG